MVAGCSDVRKVLSGGEFDIKFKDMNVDGMNGHLLYRDAWTV